MLASEENMKVVIVGFFVLSISPGISTAESLNKDQWQDICKGLARNGALIMKGRQQGVPMIKSMEIAGSKPGAIGNFMKAVV